MTDDPAKLRYFDRHKCNWSRYVELAYFPVPGRSGFWKHKYIGAYEDEDGNFHMGYWIATNKKWKPKRDWAEEDR